mmetsp:Transcript_47883/g.138508  ORF Transcript_47883/g.138508 Transcript_47883/m.138508 type:complete len:767 (-) Transcript_47883:54-2354(-)
MFDFDFEDLWDEQIEQEVLGTWAYVGRQGRTTYKVSRTHDGQLCFEGPSATGAVLSGFLQPVQGLKDYTLQASLTRESTEESGTIRLSLAPDRKALVSKFQAQGKDAWGQDIVAHRTEEASADKAAIRTDSAATPSPSPGLGRETPAVATAARAQRREEQPPVPAKVAPQPPPQKLPSPSPLDALQQPLIHDEKVGSKSPFAAELSALSRDVLGINVLVGLDKALKKGNTWLSVMAVGSSLVGFVLSSKDERKPEISVHYLVVHGRFRGKGAGCNLLKHIQDRCIADKVPRMVATCRYDQLFYLLRVGFYFSLQPPPELRSPSAETLQRLHHVRFGVEHPLGRPASGLLGRPPSRQPLPETAAAWSELEKEFFQRTGGKYVVEEVDKLRREPSNGRASIVVPTMEKRQEFHEQFCACFEAQDWPDTELVVVESYEKFMSPAVSSLARRLGRRVIHVKFQTDLTIGLKRNMGVHLATGQYIIHFDDDDLYAPGYVTAMVNGLRQRDLKALTLRSWYNCETNSGCVKYTNPEEGSWGYEGIVYGFGFSYAYYRDIAMKYPFPHISMSEDNQFMSRLRKVFGDEKVGLVRDEEGICLHLIHGNNSSGCGSHRDVALEEAAGLQVCKLHRTTQHIDSKGIRALAYLVWSQKGLSKEEAKYILTVMRRFLSMPQTKDRISTWAHMCLPRELRNRVSELMWREVYPEIFLKLGLPVDSGLDIILSSMETRFRDDPKIVAAWKEVQELQGNEEAAQKIGRYLAALQNKSAEGQ